MKPIVSCEICNNNNFKILYKKGIIEKGGAVINFDNQVCKNCGLVFLNPQPEAGDYKSIYQKYELSRHECKTEKDVNNLIDQTNNKNKSENIFNFIKEYLNNEKKVLDIGCGFGHISEGLKKRGCDVSAVEPSELLSRVVSQRSGINVFNGEFDDFYTQNNNKFNVVIMQHVFEHFIDPNNKLEQFKNILLPEGVIYMEIPNIASFKKPVNNFFDYMHPFNYSPYTIKKIVEKNGYKIIKVNKDKKYRIQFIISLKTDNHKDVGDDGFWNKGSYGFIKFFILWRGLIDKIKNK